MPHSENGQDDGDMVRQEAWNWVLRLTSGEATKADLSDLEKWCALSPRHADAFVEANGRWQSFGPALENMAHRKSAELSVVKTKSARPVLGRRAFLSGALAASVAGGVFIAVRPPLGLWPSATELAADYRTATGEQRRIALADTGTVEMNTRTSLNLNADPVGIDRIDLIAGEAAFSTRAKAVAVTAGKGRVTADAANFSVRCDGPDVSVTCVKGEIEVVLQGSAMTLRQNQQIAYAANGFGLLTDVEAAMVTGWRDGELYFRDVPLSHVIDEVNRYRVGHIFLMNGNLGQRRYTARFKLDRLETVVTQLEAAFGARVTKLPGAVIIIS
ncbi:MAG: iron dicitrate transport regulator FecR [Bradyrhizobiaceae bacterium PARB1]|jgi:transmembrane sensor|nr:MAG: iron dicitrate transport regulator FecR [Bradyrhizobiaceae bacterium PARB1]